MQMRWLVAIGAGFLTSAAVNAQPDVRPTDLPPLLPVPSAPVAPVPGSVPGPPPITVYDPGYQYLPEQAPEQVRLGGVTDPPWRWWFNTSLELAWAKAHSIPHTLKLRPVDALGRKVPGLHIPLAGNTPDPFRVGLGLSVGRWFGEDALHAVEGSFYVLPETTRTFDGFAPGTLVVFPDNPKRSSPVLIRVPSFVGVFGTTFPITASSWFAGADVNYRVGLLIGSSWRLDLLAGYRFAYLEDSLSLGERPDPDYDESRWNRLTVENAFHGGQLGLSGEYRSDTWYAEGSFKLAYGGVTSTMSANGVWLYTDPTIRLRSDTQSAWLPTTNFRLGYRFSDQGRAFVGYSFQHLSHVTRLGHAFDYGPRCDNFWVQSVNLGFEWRF